MYGSLRNLIIASLPVEQRNRVLASAEHLILRKQAVLFDLDKPITSVYFPEDAVVSLVNVLSDGSAVESATIGQEGMVGLPIFLGATTMSAQAFVQVEGTGYRLSVEDFRSELERGPDFRLALNRYTQALISMISQTSACNRRHSAEERCARWLLLTHDRVGGDSFELTQKFLALMLGVRRATVTVAVGMLHKAGLIDNERGVITVVNREGLENASCECYAIVRNEFARLQGSPPVVNPLAGVNFSEDGESTVADVAIEGFILET
jgi:CRP-like cAMP-binding protein